jgi:hypothetical protein
MAKNISLAVEAAGAARQGRHHRAMAGAKGAAGGKAVKKEAKMVARKEMKMIAKVVRNKKTAVEFGNHKPFESKNTAEKPAKNCYNGQS